VFLFAFISSPSVVPLSCCGGDDGINAVVRIIVIVCEDEVTPNIVVAVVLLVFSWGFSGVSVDGGCS